MLEQKFLASNPTRWSALALLGFLWALPHQAEALMLHRCHVPGIAEEVRCGTFDVAENRDQPGRQISLDIVVLPARSAQAKPDALFFMAGGPGQGATDNVAYAELFLHRVRETRDLVFVDQRGTGDSNPLQCELADELAGFAEELPPDEVAKCRAELEQRADLTRYTTFHAMPDLDAVRAALGYEQINLWGGSYGTRAALVYQQLYPQHTRSLILDGMAPFSVTLPTYNAREAQRALDRVFADCAAEADCSQRFPDLPARFDELLARFDAQPANITIDHPRTGHSVDLVVTRETLLGTLRGVLYSAQRANLIPLLIDRAYQGDLKPWIALGLQLIGGTGKSMSIGMTLSVLCSEDLPRVDSQELAAAVEGTYWGASDYRTWADACADWPRAELAADFAQPVASQVPALLLSGDLDPIVPPVWGEEVAKHLGNSLHLVVPGTSHNTSHVGCVPRLVASFVEQGSVEGLDASCIESVRRPPFVLDFFGANP